MNQGELRRRVLAAFDEAESADLRELPGVMRLVRPGPWGTYPEDTDGSAPKAPTLDSGPLYVGEYREEVAGDYRTIPGDGSLVVLATLRRVWPFVGAAIDTSKVPGGLGPWTVSLRVLLSSGAALILSNLVIPSPPQITGTGRIPVANGWGAITGIPMGARAEVVVQQTSGTPFPMRGTVWGYNAPGFGP